MLNDWAEEHTMDLELAGKNVIVTGGSRGIGFAIAKAFAEEGANVSICARSTNPLMAAETVLKEYGTTVHSTICDVSDPIALDNFVHLAHEALGGLNVLVNNPSGFGNVALNGMFPVSLLNSASIVLTSPWCLNS